MDEQQYAEEGYEEYAEYETRSPLWMWIVLALAMIAAIVFGTLWYLRGGEVGRLNGEMQSARSAAESAAQSLQRDLDGARSQVAAGAARITELENRLRDEQRRAGETVQQAERRLREEIDGQAVRLRAANAELETLRGRLAETEEREKAATEGVAAGTAAQERLSAVQEQLTAAQADAGKAKELEEELARAKETITNLETTVGDLRANAANIGRELTTANEELRRAGQDRRELAEIRSSLAEARERLTGVGGGGGAVPLMANRTGEADAANSASTLRETLAHLEAKYADAQRELSERAAAQETTGATAAAEMQSRLDQAEKRAQAAEAAAAAKQAAEGAEPQTDSRIAQLAARLEDAGGTIARLEEKEKGLEATRDSLTARLTAIGDELRTAVNDRQKARADLEAAEKRAQQAEKNFGERLNEAEQKLVDREKELQGDFERQKGEWQQQLDELKKAMEQPEPAQAAEAEEVPQAEATATVPVDMPKDVSTVPVAGEPMQDEPKHVIIGQPGRAVGRVAQVLQDGRYLINGGARQRVKPGMLFDVHRRLGGINRYIGLLMVTQVLDDYSLAVPAVPAHDARVCPVTGRVVLDPYAAYSPYARTEDGRRVPLIAASVLGLGQEKPALGDCVDNPYYDPRRLMVFSHDEETRNDPRVEELIVGLGGMVDDSGGPSDYEVVGNIDPGADPVATPRQVAVEALAAYVTPAHGK